MHWSMCQVSSRQNKDFLNWSNLISWGRNVKVTLCSSVSFFMCPLFSILPSIKQMDDRVLIEAVLLPAFPLTPPTVNGHKLHLCLCEKQRNKSWTVNFQTTEMVWCVFIVRVRAWWITSQQSDKYKLIFYELYSLFLSWHACFHNVKPLFVAALSAVIS